MEEPASPGPVHRRRAQPDSPGPWAHILPSGKKLRRTTVLRAPGTGAVSTVLGAPGALEADPPSPRPWGQRGGREVNLSFVPGSGDAIMLAINQATGGKDRKLNKFEMCGLDAEEARRSFNSGDTSCRCAAHGCHLGLSWANFLGVRQSFWTLLPEERAHILRGMYHSAAGFSGTGWGTSAFRPPNSRAHDATKWHLCVKLVCFSSFTHLLGTTQGTVLKMVHGIPDGRSASRKEPNRPASTWVDYFSTKHTCQLLSLYLLLLRSVDVQVKQLTTNI